MRNINRCRDGKLGSAYRGDRKATVWSTNKSVKARHYCATRSGLGAGAARALTMLTPARTTRCPPVECNRTSRITLPDPAGSSIHRRSSPCHPLAAQARPHKRTPGRRTRQPILLQYVDAVTERDALDQLILVHRLVPSHQFGGVGEVPRSGERRRVASALPARSAKPGCSRPRRYGSDRRCCTFPRSRHAGLSLLVAASCSECCGWPAFGS